MKEQLRKSIGTKIRKIRDALGYTQNKMVSFFDIGRANYSRIEKGEIFPTALILSALHDNFNVSLDWLIADNGEMFRPKNSKRNGMINQNFGKYSDEVDKMLSYMEKVPMLTHAILSFFLEYIIKNKDVIQGFFDENPAQVGSSQE